jgi:hypothetical protein
VVGLRRRLGALVGLVVALTVVGPASAHTYSPSHYAAPCSSGSGTYNAFFHVLRPNGLDVNDNSTWGAYVAIKSQVNVISLEPCTSATSTQKGWSIVNAVSGEVFNSIISSYAFVQFGYAEEACAPGSCYDTFSPYVTDFWYTAYDNQNGNIYRADWVDFNNDGVHDKPKVTDRYEFSILQGTYGGNPVWTYCVKVITSNTYAIGASDCALRARTSGPYGYLNRVYYGAETYNDASAIGVGSSGPGFDMATMQYKNYNGSIYSTVTNAVCVRARLDGTNRIPWNSQKCSVTDYIGSSHLEIWTALHS